MFLKHVMFNNLFYFALQTTVQFSSWFHWHDSGQKISTDICTWSLRFPDDMAMHFSMETSLSPMIFDVTAKILSFVQTKVNTI